MPLVWKSETGNQEWGAHPLPSKQTAEHRRRPSWGPRIWATHPRKLSRPQRPVGGGRRAGPAQSGQDVVGGRGEGPGHQVPALPPPRTAEAPLEDTAGRYYQLPIARADVHVLASWEELARHEVELLQVGRGAAHRGHGSVHTCLVLAPTAGHMHRPVYGSALLCGVCRGRGSAQPPDSPPPPPGCTRSGRLCLQPGQVVGLDLEWRPSFGAWDRPPASLMQVAVEGRVFLLDLLALTQPVDGQASQALSGLVSRLLSDPSITKLCKCSLPPAPAAPTLGAGGAGRVGPLLDAHHPLGPPTGYGMAGDLKRLAASCPTLAHASEQLQGGLDLLPVHRQVSARAIFFSGPPTATLPLTTVTRAQTAGPPRGPSMCPHFPRASLLWAPLRSSQHEPRADRRAGTPAPAPSTASFCHPRPFVLALTTVAQGSEGVGRAVLPWMGLTQGTVFTDSGGW